MRGHKRCVLIFTSKFSNFDFWASVYGLCMGMCILCMHSMPVIPFWSETIKGRPRFPTTRDFQNDYESMHEAVTPWASSVCATIMNGTNSKPPHSSLNHCETGRQRHRCLFVLLSRVNYSAIKNSWRVFSWFSWRKPQTVRSRVEGSETLVLSCRRT